MSYDLTIWHAPRLRSLKKGLARLDSPKKASAAELRRLDGLVDALLAGPLPRTACSIDPVVDRERGTLGLCLRDVAVVDGILALLGGHGMVCYDPQQGVLFYADGSSSADDQVSGGVHEGVGICLAELRADPPLPVAEQLDAMSALTQFALADSPDAPAAVALSLPVLLDLWRSPDEPVRERARGTTYNLCYELGQRGERLVLGEDVVERVRALGKDAVAAMVLGVLG